MPMKRKTKAALESEILSLQNTLDYVRMERDASQRSEQHALQRAITAEAIVDRLLRILENGTKEATFPRRPA